MCPNNDEEGDEVYQLLSSNYVPSTLSSQVALVVKNPHANTGDIRDTDSILGLGRYPRGGHGNPLQYSCLEDPHGQRSLAATVHGVAKNQTRLK